MKHSEPPELRDQPGQSRLRPSRTPGEQSCGWDSGTGSGMAGWYFKMIALDQEKR